MRNRLKVLGCALIGIGAGVLLLWPVLNLVPAVQADTSPAPIAVSIGKGLQVQIIPVRIDGLDVTIQATTAAHPGLLRFTVKEKGTYYDQELGEALWRAAAGKATSTTLSIHLNRSPSTRTAIVGLEVAAVADSPISLLPGAAGALTASTITGCGAPLADPPTTAEIRRRLQKITPPAELAGLWKTIAAVGDQDLVPLFQSAAQAVHCVSSGPAPAKPDQVPAEEVKLWLTQVVLGQNSPWAALRPLAAALPPAVARWGYLRAVELKRGLPVGSLGENGRSHLEG